MASGLHIWSQFPPIITLVTVGAETNSAETSLGSRFVWIDLLRLERANGQARLAKIR
jgi:hypothetical protein